MNSTGISRRQFLGLTFALVPGIITMPTEAYALDSDESTEQIILEVS